MEPEAAAASGQDGAGEEPTGEPGDGGSEEDDGGDGTAAAAGDGTGEDEEPEAEGGKADAPVAASGSDRARKAAAASAKPTARRAGGNRRGSPSSQGGSYDKLMELGARQLRSNPRQAIDTFMRALQSRGATSEARAKLGRAYLRVGDVGSAVHHLERARFQNPSYRPALWDLAGAYERIGSRSRAVQIYRELINRTEPGSREEARAREALGRLGVQ